jgi:UDP-N-acetyl-2-amino-2-deoxyglucuronate dehydrogenase
MNGQPTAAAPRFALIGAAGYIAPRHMRAIKDVGGTLVAALDPSDSVGVIDSYFPQADFFTEFERFDRHVDKLRRGGQAIDHVSICSPNYLHDAHIRFALRSGANAICEKPLVLNPWNVDALEAIQAESGRAVNTILQLRLHPAIAALRERCTRTEGRVDVDLAYVTSRGRWYHRSWKGDLEKSGGIATNIGIHFFDMLTWVFGPAHEVRVGAASASGVTGVLELERARVRWFLSIDERDLPAAARESGARTFRSVTVAGTEIEFSEGFTDLHTLSYREILAGRGFPLAESRRAIEIAHGIRVATASGRPEDMHPAALGGSSAR